MLMCGAQVITEAAFKGCRRNWSQKQFGIVKPRTRRCCTPVAANHCVFFGAALRCFSGRGSSATGNTTSSAIVSAPLSRKKMGRSSAKQKYVPKASGGGGHFGPTLCIDTIADPEGLEAHIKVRFKELSINMPMMHAICCGCKDDHAPACKGRFQKVLPRII